MPVPVVTTTVVDLVTVVATLGMAVVEATPIKGLVTEVRVVAMEGDSPTPGELTVLTPFNVQVSQIDVNVNIFPSFCLLQMERGRKLWR